MQLQSRSFRDSTPPTSRCPREKCGDVVGRSVRLGVFNEALLHLLPEARPRPALIARINGNIGTKLCGAFPPGRAGAQHMENAGNHPPVVNASGSAISRWQQGLDTGPFCVCQPFDATHWMFALRAGAFLAKRRGLLRCFDEPDIVLGRVLQADTD